MFVDRFIQLLRSSTYSDSSDRESGVRLAAHLEARRIRPWGDGFDVDATGNDEKDRELLAAWIEAGAHAPAYCAPGWGRNFSEETAALLRHRLEGPHLDYEKAREIRWSEKRAKMGF